MSEAASPTEIKRIRKANPVVKKHKPRRTFQWHELKRYINKAAKGKLTGVQMQKFLAEAATTWPVIAPYLLNEHRKWFIRKVSHVFKKMRVRVPVWEPNILPDGSLTSLNAETVKQKTVELQERAKEMYDPDSDVSEIQQYEKNLKALWLKESYRVDYERMAEQAQEAGIQVDAQETEDDSLTVWNVKYPNGHEHTLELDKGSDDTFANAVAWGNWYKMKRVTVTDDDLLRIEGTKIPVAAILEMKDRGHEDHEILKEFPSLTFDDLIAAHYMQNEMPERIKNELGEVRVLLSKGKVDWYEQKDEVA